MGIFFGLTWWAQFPGKASSREHRGSTCEPKPKEAEGGCLVVSSQAKAVGICSRKEANVGAFFGSGNLGELESGGKGA